MTEIKLLLRRLPATFLIGLVRLYQWTISPLLGPSCRFHPTCSAYACRCLHDHGAVRGSWLTLRRLGRCHPWHPGGVDLPPPPTPRLEAAAETTVGGSS